MKNTKKGFLWFIQNIEEIIACVAIAVMLLAVMLNVFLRYVFNSPTAWSDELAVIGMAYVTFVGGAAAYKRNLHYGIDLIIEKLPQSVQHWMHVVMTLAFIVLFAVMTYIGFNLTVSAKKLMTYTGWSYKIMDAALPLGFFSMTVYSIRYFVMSIVKPELFDERYKKMYDDESVEENGGETA